MAVTFKGELAKSPAAGPAAIRVVLGIETGDDITEQAIEILRDP